MPYISVIIPTFGRTSLLERALNSVISQTFSDIEIIIVIDGIDKDTSVFIDSIDDQRIVKLQLDHKHGAGPARDAGVRCAGGEWVAFLDDDDEWLPQKLELQVELTLLGPAIITTLCSVTTFGRVQVRPEIPYADDQLFDEWLFSRRSWMSGGGFVQSSSLMVPKSLFEVLKFSDMGIHDDWEFTLRAIKQFGLPLKTVLKALTIHHFEEQSNTLQSTLPWRKSIDWANSISDLLSREAYSGFLLSVVARAAANKYLYGAAPKLLLDSFRAGAPTTKQLFAFLMVWLLPLKIRRNIRASLSSRSFSP